VGKLDRRGRFLYDAADEVSGQRLHHADERLALRGVRARVDVNRGAGRCRFAADLVDAEVGVRGERGDDGEPVEGDAVDLAAVDLPREQRLTPTRRGF